MKSVSRIMVIAAHPDDEVLGCGGVVARMAGEGKEVLSVILGEGMTARFGSGQAPSAEIMKTLTSASRKAGTILGVKEVKTYNLPDNRFDTMPLLDIVKIIESGIDEFQPELVFTHHSGDLNIDHNITHRAVLTATRPLSGHSVKAVLSFYIPSATEWAFNQFGPGFRPNVFVDIFATLEEKIKALACYESEMRAFPHPRSPEAIRAIAANWGTAAGVEAAEPFELVRSIF